MLATPPPRLRPAKLATLHVFLDCLETWDRRQVAGFLAWDRPRRRGFFACLRSMVSLDDERSN